MDHLLLQSTLREMQAVAQSRRLWLTFLAVVSIFVLTGPFGTSETMGLSNRLVYWTVVHLGAWTLAVSFSIAANNLLSTYISLVFARMMVGSLVAALPIGAFLGTVNALMLGRDVSPLSMLHCALSALPLCAIFCLLTYLTALEKPEAVAPTIAKDESHVPLLERLPSHKRGDLLRLSVQDHYTEIVTTRGRQLVLLRFADALREIGTVEGTQVHRSHWVADADAVSLKRAAGRLAVVTRDGAQIPVSRTCRAAVLARFADRPAAG